MALEKQADSRTTFLQVKHFSIWREIKRPVEGCEELTVTNPKTGQVVTKYGYKYRTLSGRVTKIVKYDTADKYPTRYFGFKMHIQDGVDAYVLDMPYQSQVLRRFLRVAPNFDWTKPIAISVFKGKSNGKKSGDETGIWFQQSGETVKAFYSRETPNGAPQATQDPDTHEWDFKKQHRWLIERLLQDTVPKIERAAALVQPPVEVDRGEDADQGEQQTDFETGAYVPSDDDVPF